MPVQNVKEFVDYVKASPGKYAYGSFGSGTTAHFAGEIVLNAAGLKMTHVPYKGSAPAMTDLIGGQIPFSVDTVTRRHPATQGGKIKAIAVTTAKRSALLPDVPDDGRERLTPASTWTPGSIVAAPQGPAGRRQGAAREGAGRDHGRSRDARRNWSRPAWSRPSATRPRPAS